jgi:hypothetical protein
VRRVPGCSHVTARSVPNLQRGARHGDGMRFSRSAWHSAHAWRAAQTFSGGVFLESECAPVSKALHYGLSKVNGYPN